MPATQVRERMRKDNTLGWKSKETDSAYRMQLSGHLGFRCIRLSDLQNWKRIIDLCYILKWNLNVFFKLVIRLLIVYFWLRWVFVAAHPLSLAAARGLLLSCGARAACCGGFPFCGAWRSVRGRRWLSYVGSLVVVHELSCSMARGIPPD